MARMADKVTQGVIWEDLGHPPESKGRMGGYAQPPGTGPVGETCKTCRFKTYNHSATKRFLKCELLRHAWTHGEGTDIKAKSPACRVWEQKF